MTKTFAIAMLVAGIFVAVFVHDSMDSTAQAQPATQPSTQPGKELVLNLDDKVTLKLVLIPAGKFIMGSPAKEAGRESDEGPQRQVTISKPFYMGVYEVTKGQFAAFVADSGYKTDAEKGGWAYALDGSKWGKVNGASWRKLGFDQTDHHPVVCVSYNDSVAFCRWLSKRTGKTVALPTESQWEYACRGGSKTAYPWGDDPDDGKGWANCADKTAKKEINFKQTFGWEDGYVYTAAVGQFKENNFGLYDMIGNVWEWCSDWYGSYPRQSEADPKGLNSGLSRVLRGGSWGDIPAICRSANRNRVSPDNRYYNVCGFRVVVDFE